MRRVAFRLRVAFVCLGAAPVSVVHAHFAYAAEGPARVLVLGPSEKDPMVERLKRELALLGLRVEVLTPGGDDPRELAESARARHADAALAIRPSPPGIVLWIDPVRSPTASAEIQVDEQSAGSAEPRLLVLRAVEILRERLLPPPPAPNVAAPPASPLPSPDAPSPPPAPLPPTVAREAASQPRIPSAFLGPAIVASPGNLGAMPEVWLGARWAPLRRMDLELLALVPTTAVSASGPEGSMTFRAGAVAAGVAAKLVAPTSDLFVDAGAGFGVMLAGFEGQARPPLVSAGGVRATMLPYAHASVGYWVASRIAVRGDLLTGFALPEPVLTIAGQKVAAFGEPLAAFSASVELRP
jgi:hypothetical protein